MDLMDTIKSVIATVAKLREITKKMEQVELKSTIADLSNQLVDAQSQVVALKAELLAQKAANAALATAKNTQRPTHKWGCYEFQNESGLYCPACYDTQGKKHITTRKSAHERVCSVCRTTLYA